MSKVALIAKLPAAPGKRDQLAAALAPLIEAVEAESGCRMYVLHDDAKDENLLWFYELYDDQAALDAHMNGEMFKSIGGQIGGFLGGAPELIMVTPRAGKGL